MCLYLYVVSNWFSCNSLYLYRINCFKPYFNSNRIVVQIGCYQRQIKEKNGKNRLNLEEGNFPVKGKKEKKDFKEEDFKLKFSIFCQMSSAQSLNQIFCGAFNKRHSSDNIWNISVLCGNISSWIDWRLLIVNIKYIQHSHRSVVVFFLTNGAP